MANKIERTVKIAYVKQVIDEKMTVAQAAKGLKVNESTDPNPDLQTKRTCVIIKKKERVQDGKER